LLAIVSVSVCLSGCTTATARGRRANHTPIAIPTANTIAATIHRLAAFVPLVSANRHLRQGPPQTNLLSIRFLAYPPYALPNHCYSMQSSVCPGVGRICFGKLFAVFLVKSAKSLKARWMV